MERIVTLPKSSTRVVMERSLSQGTAPRVRSRTPTSPSAGATRSRIWIGHVTNRIFMRTISSSVFGPTVAPGTLPTSDWEVMLRITVIETPTEQRLVLYGKLVGPWIGELQRIWEGLRQQLSNRDSVIDLNEVTLVDDSADHLLATMLEQGAELVARGMANRWLIQALKAGKTRAAVRALRPHAGALSHTVDTERNAVTTIAEGTVTLGYRSMPDRGTS